MGRKPFKEQTVPEASPTCTECALVFDPVAKLGASGGEEVNGDRCR